MASFLQSLACVRAQGGRVLLRCCGRHSLARTRCHGHLCLHILQRSGDFERLQQSAGQSSTVSGCCCPGRHGLDTDQPGLACAEVAKIVHHLQLVQATKSLNDHCLRASCPVCSAGAIRLSTHPCTPWLAMCVCDAWHSQRQCCCDMRWRPWEVGTTGRGALKEGPSAAHPWIATAAH